MADAERVTVRSGASDLADADAAAGAADVLDDHALVQRNLHALGEDARDRVGRPAGRIGHHDGDDSGWINVCRRAERAGCEYGECDRGKLAHVTSLSMARHLGDARFFQSVQIA